MNYPLHMAIIPDGCRRWSSEKGSLPWDGHLKGIEVMETVSKWLLSETPVKHLTAYGLSASNLRRPSVQLKALEKLYVKYFTKLSKDEDIHENQVRVGIIGSRDLVPEKVLKATDIAVEATADYDSKFFRVALAYSGRQEIVDAAKKSEGNLSVESISRNLYSDYPDVDLIFRTSECRLSDFMLWGSSYSELYFLDKYWPDVTIDDIKTALEDYDSRQRRHGK
ncbi:TPA: di-trans,poly-cis-decaprenylcistransferase [archaeon]|uniref:Tritrans,polycis-undecaprenyl-diphosphate synthase (geranylgeranyl-diphosphate specific) n=1 Tax=Candidatus Undinarchaeum marinum TaxID=2756141 RepID=A0A832UPR9_9ARCH|nr:di-trans,poly-cis-decaprenylcistransferase [Candidatus Undinarchaeum marinum]